MSSTSVARINRRRRSELLSCLARDRADNADVAVLQANRSNAQPTELRRGEPAELSRILRMQVPVIVKLAERQMSMSEVLRLGVGAIIEFSKANDQPLDLLINNKSIAIGEAVKIGENFGLRITQVGDVKSIIRSMGQ